MIIIRNVSPIENYFLEFNIQHNIAYGKCFRVNTSNSNGSNRV